MRAIMLNCADDEIAVHLNPVWRDRAAFIIYCDIREKGQRLKWEQLWCRRVKPTIVELCCIPVFARNLALGDHVSIPERPHYTLQNVIHRSGHATFRMFIDSELTSGVAAQAVDQI